MISGAPSVHPSVMVRYLHSSESKAVMRGASHIFPMCAVAVQTGMP